MHFDPVDARLVTSPDEFGELVRDLADRQSPTGDVPAQVVTMVSLVVDPLRSIVVERLDADDVRSLHVGTDDTGCATVTERRPNGSLWVTATHVTLLPALLLQALRLHPGLDVVDERLQIRTDQAGLGAALDSLTGPAGPTSTWRASAAWRDAHVDTDLRVVSTGERGLWEVARSADTTEVTLRPRSVASTAALLGDVVTGRAGGCNSA